MSGYPNAGDWTGHICRDIRMLGIGPYNVRLSDFWGLDRTYKSGYPNAGDWTGQCYNNRFLGIGPDIYVGIPECWRLDKTVLEYPNAEDRTGHTVTFQ